MAFPVDPETISTAVAQSIEIVETILTFCRSCKEAYNDLPFIVELIQLECNKWKALLARLEDRPNTNNPSGPSLDFAPSGILEKVRDSLSRSDAFIRDRALKDDTGVKVRLEKAINWIMLENGKIRDLLNELGSIKTNFSLALDVDSKYGRLTTSACRQGHLLTRQQFLCGWIEGD